MEKYGYLILTIPFLVVLGWIYIRRPDLRHSILKVGIIGGIVGLISELWYFQDYWRPDTLFGFGIPSLEDFLFGFGVIGLGAMLPIYVLKLTWPKKRDGRRKRILALALGALLAMVVLTSVLKVNSIVTSYIIFLVITAIGLIKRPWLWKSMLISAVSLVLLGAIVYWIGSVTGLFDWQNTEVYLVGAQAWAPVYLGFLPLTELIWYALWGTAAAALPYIVNNPKQTGEKNSNS